MLSELDAQVSALLGEFGQGSDQMGQVCEYCKHWSTSYYPSSTHKCGLVGWKPLSYK